MRFGHLDFENLNLFRISIFEFRIYRTPLSLRGPYLYSDVMITRRLHAEALALVLPQTSVEL